MRPARSAALLALVVAGCSGPAGPTVILGEPLCFADEAAIRLEVPRTRESLDGCATFDVEGGGTMFCHERSMRIISVSAPRELDVASMDVSVELLALPETANRTVAMLSYDPTTCECEGAGVTDDSAEIGPLTATDVILPPGADPTIMFGLSNTGALYRVRACFTVR